MRKFFIISILVFSSSVFSQDTLLNAQNFSAVKILLLADDSDTSYVRTYNTGEIESKQGYSKYDKVHQYERFYRSGKTMWKAEIENNMFNGDVSYFSEKGKKVAQFIYKSDTIIDTVFIHPNYNFVIGTMHFSFVMYGGMMREDGTSNVSVSGGAKIFEENYVVKLDKSKKIQKEYTTFLTDYSGHYFVLLEKGAFGFFNEKYPIEKVKYNMGTASNSVVGVMEGAWNYTEPFVLKNGFLNINLLYSSAGYAP